MRDGIPRGSPVEAGSALVVVLLVLAILSLLGLAFALTAETELRIAETELRSAQALYLAEAGARAVKQWFDGPRAPSNLANPPIAAVDRTLRRIDDDGDPATAPHLQDGTSWPRYKQGTDLDADGADDLFEKPYRGGGSPAEALRNRLLGTEEGPDMRIAEGSSPAATGFLEGLSTSLVAESSSARSGIAARISAIDVYAAPSLDVAGGWTRFGIATVKVTARIRRTAGSADEILAERSVKVVLNEVPEPRLLGPLETCGGLRADDGLEVLWGAVVAAGPFTIPGGSVDSMPRSVPRAVPTLPNVDLLHGWNSPAGDLAWNDLKAHLEAGADIDDPWFRVLGGGPVVGAAPEPSPQLRPPVTTGQDHSNLFQNLPGIACPDLDYDTWKAIALAGGGAAHYYAWAGGTTFRENGLGPPEEFETLTCGRTGLFFFDTRDGNRPSETLDSDGLPVNLTPALRIGADGCGVRGLVYLNAAAFETAGAPGIETVLRMPGEPFRDLDEDGVRGDGEPWINLDFAGVTSLTDPLRGNASDDFGNPGGGPIHNATGPAFVASAVVDGVLYTRGTFASRGARQVYGSVIARGGIASSRGATGIYWNDSLRRGVSAAPWGLPRVMVTRWETDPR